MEKKREIKNKDSKIKRNIVLAVLIIALGLIYIIERGEYLEIKEIGENYVPMFWKNFRYIAITGSINFIISFLIIYTTTSRVKKGLKIFYDDEKRDMPKLPQKSISFIVATLVTIFTSGYILEKALVCFNNAQFVISEPVFGYDIGYFVFIWPFILLLVIYALIAVTISTIYGALYYLITFNVSFDGVRSDTLKKSLIMSQALNNLKVLLVFLASFVLIEIQNIGIQKFIILNTGTVSTYPLYGAGTTEINIKLWAYILLAIVIIYSGFRAIHKLKKGETKKVIKSILIVPVYLLIVLAVMLGYNLIFVNSNELDKEKSYIANNIKYTQMAYNIEIDEEAVKDEGTIAESKINLNLNTINNIPITNAELVLKDLNSSLTNKEYYRYNNSSIAQYKIDGENKLVFITPREISNGSGTYNNKTYEYTHGYGAILTLATETLDTGNLNHIQKAFDKSDEKVKITNPRIYFGMQTNSTVVTNSNSKAEFDYPTVYGVDNTETIYSGDAGLEANFLDRLVLAIKEKDAKLLFSGNVKSDSKILTNRNVIERAKVVMPNLIYDDEPYIVITNEGNLVWVLDAYTTSNNYPYSQRIAIKNNGIVKNEINYIRNSIKVIIDAYDGETKFYIIDKTDPIAMVYKNIYPDTFTDEEIPEDIKSHFLYPKYLYKIQAEVLKRYHNVEPDILYRSNDIWEGATHNKTKITTNVGTAIEPYYTMVKTIENNDSRLGLVMPYTPNGKQNIIAYIVGSCKEDGSNYLKLYTYSNDSNVLGPMQLDTQIEQDETVSEQINLLNVTGTRLIKDMIIVPIDNCLIYVEPIYQQYVNETNSLPVLKKVVVASGNKLSIGDTFKEAINNLVSQNAVNIEIENPDNIDDLINAIIRANNNLQESTKSSDWEQIGRDTKALQDLILKLEVVQAEKIRQEDDEKILNSITDGNSIDSY